MSGYCAMGRPRIATTPSSTRMIDITIATIGRLTKKRDILAAPAGHAVLVLQFLNGALRHEQRAGLRIKEQPCPSVLTGPEHRVGIGKQELDAQRAGGCVDRALDRPEVAGLRMRGPV